LLCKRLRSCLRHPYRYECLHSLYNAHHLRELTRAYEQDNQAWVEEMRLFVVELYQEVDMTGGLLCGKRQDTLRRHYQNTLKAEGKESPVLIKVKGKCGQPKKTKSRNLLQRLQNYESDVLRSMTDDAVLFTHNLGVNNLRMVKDATKNV
jgi:transposase